MNRRWSIPALAVVGAALVAGCATPVGQTIGAVARAGGAAAVAALPIGPEKEREIGFGIAATVAGRYRVLDDPELERYVNLVGHAVAQQSVRGEEVDFHFAVLDTDEINAFAAPGGYIFVTRGSLALMESEAELAGVLAHEIGHVDEKHVLDEIRRADVIRSVQNEAELSGELLDRIAEVGGSLLFTGLSREDELEADSVGILYARGTGYRADGLLTFLRRLRAEVEDGDASVRELTATHPSTADRIGLLERQLARAGIDPADGLAVSERFRRYVRPGAQ